MTNDIITKLSQLTGLISAFAEEIDLNKELKIGEKFVILQRVFANLKPLQRAFDSQKKELENLAKDQLRDLGNGTSESITVEGAELMIKYSYPKPSLDSDKLETDYIRLLADYNLDYDRNSYNIESKPRQTVIIQSILD